MDRVKQRLIDLFEEMLAYRSRFKKKTYAGAFEEGSAKFADLPQLIEDFLSGAADQEREALLDELAAVIPQHAAGQVQKAGKFRKNVVCMDYNLNMAVYVLPFLNSTKQEDLVSLAERIVKLWNEQKVTDLTLSNSTYEEIAGGFGNTIFGFAIK